MKFTKKTQEFSCLFAIFLVTFFLHLYLNIGQFGTDDYLYNFVANNQDYYEFIVQRYIGWSGRLTVDSVMFLGYYLGIWFWRLLNSGIFVLFIYSITRLAIDPKENLTKYFLLTFALISLITSIIAGDSIFGIAQSYNYLWAVSLGIFSIIPIWEKFFFSIDTKISVFHYLALLFASFGQEQISLFITATMIIINILVYFKARSVNKQFLLFTIISIAGSIILLTAPGNIVRFGRGVEVCFPGFDAFSLKQKLLIGSEYLFLSIVNLNRNLFGIFLTILIIVMSTNKNKTKLFGVLSGLILVAISIFVLSTDAGRSHQISQYLLNFDGIVAYDQSIPQLYTVLQKSSIFSMLFWGLIIFFVVPMSIFLIYKEEFYKLIGIGLFYFGAIFTLITMFFSPTIFCSGARPRFFFSTMLILISVVLFEKISKSIEVNKIMLYSSLIIISIIGYGAYYENFNDYFISEIIINEFEYSPNNEIECGVEKIEQNNDYMAKIWGYGYTLNSQAKSSKDFLLLKSNDQTYLYSIKRLFHSQTAIQGNNDNGFLAGVNIYRMPVGKYQVGFGVLDNNDSLISTCFTDSYLDIH